MSQQLPSVSILIPCRNEKDHIANCLKSILNQKEVEGGFEVIVADGMSDDGTRDILTQLATKERQIRIVDNPARIVSAGLNCALKVSKGKIIIRIDAHTEYAPDYLVQCLNVLRETTADNVGGPARTKCCNVMQAAIRAAYHSVFAVGGARFHNVEYEGYVDTVPYGCWPREVFDRIGLFDEELVRNQDDEFNLRLTRAGGKIWQSPSIKSWYTPRGSLGSVFQQYKQYGYWKVRVIQKHKIPASVRHLVPGLFLLSISLLPLISLWFRSALWFWLALVGSYVLLNLTASFSAALQNRWQIMPILPVVFACYHFAYGVGFLRGFWDFVILRRSPAKAYTLLTRKVIHNS